MTPRRIRIGLVGARAAAETHVTAMAHLLGTRADVVAVAAATRASAEAFARRHAIPVALDDYRALVERADVGDVLLAPDRGVRRVELHAGVGG